MMACTVGDFTVILTSRQPSNSPELEIKNRILQGNDGYHMMSWVLIFVLFVYMALSYALWECTTFKATVNWSKQLSIDCPLTRPW